jgi:8-oxo-dGTP pyrophosphatase MutT (NUDIX family)
VADASFPNFKTYAEGEPIPPVDPEELKRRWSIKPPWTAEALQAAWCHELDCTAVSRRTGMVRTLIIYKLLEPWQHGDELDDAVFRVAATFPVRERCHKSYMIPGGEYFGFDPNALVQRLIEETGISHVWEPVATKVPEGGRALITWSVPSMNPERKAENQARQILWEMWKRFSPSLDEIVSHSDKEHAAQVVATFFANFLLDNIDLVRQLEAAFKEPQSIPLDPILSELERRAQGRV